MTKKPHPIIEEGCRVIGNEHKFVKQTKKKKIKGANV